MHDVSCALQQAIGEIFPWRIEHLRNSRSDPAARQNVMILAAVISLKTGKSGKAVPIKCDHSQPLAMPSGATCFCAQWMRS
jgi:hypothetical protein